MKHVGDVQSHMLNTWEYVQQTTEFAERQNERERGRREKTRVRRRIPVSPRDPGLISFRLGKVINKNIVCKSPRVVTFVADVEVSLLMTYKPLYKPIFGETHVFPGFCTIGY